MAQEEKQTEGKAYSGYEQLAFGSVADAVKLLFLEEPNLRNLSKMDFFNVAEIRRLKEGAMEIKFFDRLKALEKLEEIEDKAQTEIPSFYQALDKSVQAFQESGGEEGDL